MTMDTKNQIPEYVKNLPQAVRDLILNGVWEERTLEIAKKYSLSDDQADLLSDEVLYILIGLELPEGFQDRLVAELSISMLLATQIENDLETRVFQYAVNAVEGKQGGQDKKIPAVSEDSAKVSETKVLEIPPMNLPMVEEGEKVQVKVPEVKAVPVEEKVEIATPRYVPPYKPLVENKAAGTGATVSSAAPLTAASMDPLQTPEIQRPIAVPRFTAVAMDEKGDVIPASPEKMGVPQAAPVAIALSSASPANPIQKPPEKYEVDPYLEPI
jgi:hypothetical protein